MTTARAVVLRLAAFLATLLGSIAFVGLLLVLAPGDPISLIPNGEELRPQLEAEWGLDLPLHERYLRYLGRILTLDLGTSLAYRPGQPVLEVIQGPALSSLGRVLAALSCAMAWGTALAWWTTRQPLPRRVLAQWLRGALSLPLGVLRGRQPSVVERAMAALARAVAWIAALAWWVVDRPPLHRLWLQGISIVPVFLLAHGAVLGLNEGAFALMTAGQIERPSWFALPDQPSSLRTSLSILLLAVGSGSLAEVHAQAEEALVRIQRSAYVDAARARGAPLWPHVALNLLPSLASTLAERAAFLAGGVVIVEKVLLLNGAGAILWEAALLRDYDLAMALALLAAAFVGLVRLASDAVRLAVDPRLREAG